MPPSERVFTGPDHGRCVLPAEKRGSTSGERAGTKAGALLPSVLLPVVPSRAQKTHLPRVQRGWEYWCSQHLLGCLDIWAPLTSLLMPFRGHPVGSVGNHTLSSIFTLWRDNDFFSYCKVTTFFFKHRFFPHKLVCFQWKKTYIRILLKKGETWSKRTPQCVLWTLRWKICFRKLQNPQVHFLVPQNCLKSHHAALAVK